VSTQEPLFYDSILEALKGIVVHAGGNKAVGARLRPSKAPEHAGRWLADCLNPPREERLDPDDFMALLRIGREIGFHAAMTYIANEAGYEARPIEPQDEYAHLQREYIEAVKLQAKIAARLERLSVPNVKAVA